MRFYSASFVYEIKGRTWHVVFVKGKVKLWSHVNGTSDMSRLFVVDNANRHWKPCCTHAQDLIRLYREQPARSNQAKQRVAKTRPALRLVGKR